MKFDRNKIQQKKTTRNGDLVSMLELRNKTS